MFTSVMGGKNVVRETSVFPWKILMTCESIDKLNFLNVEQCTWAYKYGRLPKHF